MSARQKNRARVAPKMGAIDVDYKTLHDAFFKHQTKPANMTKFGDTYYEGKELEVNTKIRPGQPLSSALREALGMTTDSSPPPWLLNMQRYGPPPSYPGLKIPGINAPLPTADGQYGYHPGGWGKPPMDNYGRPLYGGNPFDPPGSGAEKDDGTGVLVTSDGKTIERSGWGALPVGAIEEEESEEEESSDEEMDESSDEEEEAPEPQPAVEGVESVLPPPPVSIPSTTGPLDVRKGVESSGPKQLYKVIEQTDAVQAQPGAVFASEVAYAVSDAQDGAASVLAKVPVAATAPKANDEEEDEEDEDLGKNFKF